MCCNTKPRYISSEGWVDLKKRGWHLCLGRTLEVIRSCSPSFMTGLHSHGIAARSKLRTGKVLSQCSDPRTQVCSAVAWSLPFRPTHHRLQRPCVLALKFVCCTPSTFRAVSGVMPLILVVDIPHGLFLLPVLYRREVLQSRCPVFGRPTHLRR